MIITVNLHTDCDLALLLCEPSVQCLSLLVLHGRAFVQVLGKVALVQARRVNHLSLWDVVLHHVGLYDPSCLPRVFSEIHI